MCDLEQWHEDKRRAAVEVTIQKYVKCPMLDHHPIGQIIAAIQQAHHLTPTQAKDAMAHFADENAAE